MPNPIQALANRFLGRRAAIAPVSVATVADAPAKPVYAPNSPSRLADPKLDAVEPEA